MFENESIFLTMVILAANIGILVIATTPGFAVNVQNVEENSQAVFINLTPPGLQFWNNDGEIDTNSLFYVGTQSNSGSWVADAIDVFGRAVASVIGIDPIAILKAILQFVLFMIFGYVFLMQLFGLPSWMIFAMGAIISIIQVIGLFYIITYAINSIRGQF